MNDFNGFKCKSLNLYTFYAEKVAQSNEVLDFSFQEESRHCLRIILHVPLSNEDF